MEHIRRQTLINQVNETIENSMILSALTFNRGPSPNGAEFVSNESFVLGSYFFTLSPLQSDRTRVGTVAWCDRNLCRAKPRRAERTNFSRKSAHETERDQIVVEYVDEREAASSRPSTNIPRRCWMVHMYGQWFNEAETSKLG